MRLLEYSITEQQSGSLVKTILKNALGVSARMLIRLKNTPDGITLNGFHVTVTETVHAGDLLCVKIPDDSKIAVPSDISVPVVYEDDDLIVMDKPPFMPVHPSKKHQSDTLANAFAAHLFSSGKGASAFRPINRLDRDTSGLVVAAMHQYAAAALSGKIDKTYLCVCRGVPDQSGTFDMPIRRCADSKILREVGDGGDNAVTHFTRLTTNGVYSLLRVRIETGRTHQIRVHFSANGFPLAGDTLYSDGDDGLSRQALHCAEVSFLHPVTGKILQFQSHLPQDIYNFALKHKISTDL